jgi:hypothetical protein
MFLINKKIFKLKSLKTFWIILIIFLCFKTPEIYSQDIPEPYPLPTPIPNNTNPSILPPSINTTNPVPIPIVPESSLVEDQSDFASNNAGWFDTITIILIILTISIGSYVIILKKRVKIQS